MAQQYPQPSPRPLTSGSASRAALPGPAIFSPDGDITAVLMLMVEMGALTPAAARLVAWARGQQPGLNGAYFTTQCRPRIVWRGNDWDAVAFADTHARHSDAVLASDLAESRQKLTTWQIDAGSGEVLPPRHQALWRASGWLLAAIFWLALLVCAIWVGAMIVDGLWLWVTGGVPW